jgi:transposase
VKRFTNSIAFLRIGARGFDRSRAFCLVAAVVAAANRSVAKMIGVDEGTIRKVRQGPEEAAKKPRQRGRRPGRQ